MDALLNGYEVELDAHIKRERAGIKLAQFTGQLLYDKGVELVLFRNHLDGLTNSEILNLHEYSRKVVEKPIDVYTTSMLAEALMDMDLAPSKLDIGKLAYEYLESNGKYPDASSFLKDTLKDFLGHDKHQFKPKDVILFGFGRIGRIAARELIKQAGKGQQLRLRAIVTRETTPDVLLKRAALFKNDSVHGTFDGIVDVDVDKKVMTLNGMKVLMLEAKNPEDIDYTAYGINDALVIDNTGVFKDKEALSRHLKAKGVSKVILTAPGKEMPNVVYGINQKDINLDDDAIVSAASCTTNAISPILKVINDSFGIVKGHIETVHAYTNDQNLLDNMHKKPRRGRSAAINMVITSTGAGNAVTKVIPELKDKLTANAVRVPTPNGSLAIMSLELQKGVNLEDVNKAIRYAALNGNLVNQIYYSIDEELVSSDIIGNTCCSVYDAPATIVSKDNKNVVLYTWYDNEFGYTKQVIRLAKYVAKVRRLIYY
ncbi:MAG: glyceraldehyde-3-phosphate dehydrogenase [Brumimicrobium sp.]|nr:glyceraldehyde-3-phosphate dehydrogenase [Brumimicrobium sp.]MCO5269104.1 glyceraldehyde-3-phosphate dehydrogenase [Brumimicrobium sp.]